MVLSLYRLLRTLIRYRSSLIKLSQLNDRELSDIGISRSDITRITWEGSDR
jgi:uncharacterized protein YjiS (DUF1127 family)